MDISINASTARFGALLAVIFLLPLSGYSYRTEYWGPLVIAVLLIAAWQLSDTESVARTWQRLDWRGRVVVAGLVFITVYTALQALGISVHSHLTTTQAIRALAYTSLFWLVIVQVNSERRARLMLWALVAAGVVQAVLGASQALMGGEEAVGTYANRNLLAGLLEMTLAAAIALIVADLSREPIRWRGWRAFVRGLLDSLLSWKMLARVLAAVMVVALILTRSRMGNTAFFVSLLVVAVVGILVFRRSSLRVVILFGSIILIDTLLLGTFFGLDRLQERMEDLTVDRGRLEVNRSFLMPADASGGSDVVEANAAIGLRLAEDSWTRVVTGYGAGTFYTIYPALQSRETSGVFMPYAHNDYLQVWLEYGLVGFLAFVALGVAFFGQILHELRRRHGQFRKAVRLGSFMAALSLAIHSTVDFNLQWFANAGTLCVFLALAFCEFGNRRKRKAKSNA